MIHWLLYGLGYQILSGPLGDTAIISGLLVMWHQRNCHVQGCWRLQWHPHPDHGHPVCRRHHPHKPPSAP